MNLLPKTHTEFSKAEYWNEFFKKRGKKAFEWYGEYPELCGQLLKYVKPKDDVLVVGCGNSTLSMDLYDVGYRSVTSIDVSKVVIKQMKEKNKEQRPNLTYEVMDATAMTYPDGKFSVVLDKGTFDALMPDSQSETLDTIDKYLVEIARVLRRGGRYVCITLLQEHILRKLVEHFSCNEFMVRLARCHEAEAKTRADEGSAFPVFILIATKFPGLPHPVLELALTDDKAVRVAKPEEIVSGVLAAQQSALVCNSLKKRSLSEIGEVSLDLYSPGNDQARYTIHVLDRQDVKVVKSYAAFIVPQGRDTDWIFGTADGRRELLKNVPRDRLAVVILRRDNTFENMEKVKEELGPSVKNFAPSELPNNYVIDFLSLAAHVGKREIRCKGESKLSGPYVVEDVLGDDGHALRRLIFLNNQFIVQSEARLKSKKNRHRDRKHGASKAEQGKTRVTLDHGYLACEHHLYMCVAAAAASMEPIVTNSEVLVLGLGGGSLCTFLHQCFPKIKITAVDIDEEILHIATSWFDLHPDDRLRVEVADGIEFVARSAKVGTKFDAILLDVDSKDNTVGMSCPPKCFLEPEFLRNVVDCLSQQNGLFVLNLVCRDKNLRPKILSELKAVFPSLLSFNLENHLNEIFVCSRREKTDKDFKDLLARATDKLNKQANAEKLSSRKIIELSCLLESLTVW